MPIVVAHRSTKATTLQAKYEDPIILDVTSKGPEPWVRFSPFYPHGSIPVPFSASSSPFRSLRAKATLYGRLTGVVFGPRRQRFQN